MKISGNKGNSIVHAFEANCTYAGDKLDDSVRRCGIDDLKGPLQPPKSPNISYTGINNSVLGVPVRVIVQCDSSEMPFRTRLGVNVRVEYANADQLKGYLEKLAEIMGME